MRTLIIKVAIASGATILGFVYIGQHRTIRQNTDIFFQGAHISGQDSILTSRQQRLIGVQYALRENDIIQAINTMPTQTAKDLYNRATLKTIRAYQLMQQEDQNYKQTLQEAQNDFRLASAKTNNIYLQNRIKNNASISQNIQYIADIQICFTSFDTLLTDLDNIQASIEQTQTSIQDQLQYIQKNTSKINQNIGEDCQQKIQNAFSTSYDALTKINQTIGQHADSYNQLLNTYIDNPGYCLETNFMPIIQSAELAEKTIKEAQETYSITAMALQTNNADILQQICEQTQNDTLRNQSIEQSVSQLLRDLEQQKQSVQSSTPESGDQESIQQDQNNTGPTTIQPQYIPLTQEEKTLLEQIQQTNNQRIQTMMQIKKNNYNPSQAVQTIFEIFYGDPSEFAIPGW